MGEFAYVMLEGNILKLTGTVTTGFKAIQAVLHVRTSAWELMGGIRFILHIGTG